jgi:hypothetical protein
MDGAMRVAPKTWVGKLSHSFIIQSDGCLLIPHLFYSYLKDIDEEIERSNRLANVNNRMLVFLFLDDNLESL